MGEWEEGGSEREWEVNRECVKWKDQEEIL